MEITDLDIEDHYRISSIEVPADNEEVYDFDKDIQ